MLRFNKSALTKSTLFTSPKKNYSTKKYWETTPSKKPTFADQYLEALAVALEENLTSSSFKSFPPVLGHLEMDYGYSENNISKLVDIYETAVCIEKDFEKIRGNINIRQQYKSCENFTKLIHPDHGITAFKWSVYERLVTLHSIEIKKDYQRKINSGELSEYQLLSMLDSQKKEWALAKSIDTIKQEAEKKAIQELLEYRSNHYIVIPNRGLIADKVIKTAAKEKYKTIHVCHKNDKNPHADHAIILTEHADYNNVEKIMEKLNEFRKTLPAKAKFYIHPCYGYTSENPAMPDACEKNNIIFVGPTADSMRALGDKSYARMTAKKLNIPVVPGDDGENQNRAWLIERGRNIGFPVMIKTTDGGGGTGNRVVFTDQELENILTTTFASKTVVLEKFLINPKHFEVQLAIDAKDVVILSTRDCSIQRRYQKIVEEAPAQTPHASKLREYALLIGNEAQRLGYTGVMTAEFMQDGENIVFNENNTRIQVEHSVTEDIYENKINVSALQIHIAIKKYMQSYFKAVLPYFNENLSLQENVDALERNSKVNASIEVRINAQEILYNQEFDSATRGTITACNLPTTKGRGHIDSVISQGMEIDTSETNSLIMIIRGTGKTKDQALSNLHQLLSETKIEGIHTNLDYLKFTVDHMMKSSESFHVGTCRHIDRLHVIKLEEDKQKQEEEKQKQLEELNAMKLQEEEKNRAYYGGFRC